MEHTMKDREMTPVLEQELSLKRAWVRLGRRGILKPTNEQVYREAEKAGPEIWNERN